jgi:1-acyl-sn-glycerol-3-phosphate acyltransferase
MDNPGSVASSLFAVYQTLMTSAKCLSGVATGRLSIARVDFLLEEWSRNLVNNARVQLTVEGRENIPDRPLVLMSNHQSQSDIPIIFVAYRKTLRMVAKAELFKVPVWGPALRASGFISVDRSGNRERAKAAMAEAGRTIGEGVSVWIAPEGTRADDAAVGLGPFKKGGFLLARDAGVQILPVGVIGSAAVLPKHGMRIVRDQPVTVRFGKPIDSGKPPTLDALMGEVRGAIENLIV